MRLFLFSLLALACCLAVVAGWDKEDHEIFSLKERVESSEGEGVTFYDFLEVPPSASQEDIKKAFKKKSVQLHPDKALRKFKADRATGKGESNSGKKGKPGVHVSKGPSASETKAALAAINARYQCLTTVANVLKGAGRERYDHFLSNGFPKWKGTNYYYSRYRPGLGVVLSGLFIFVGGGAHWLALLMTWKRQRDFVERYIRNARHSAWGDNLDVPGLEGTATPPVAGGDDSDAMAQGMNRRQRRLQAKDARKEKGEKPTKSSSKPSPVATPPTGSVGPRKKVQAENGKMLVVDSVGNVFLEQVDEDGKMAEFLLDPNEFHRPTIKDTALYRLPVWAFNAIFGRFTNKVNAEEEYFVEGEAGDPTSSSSEPEDFEVLEKVKTTAQNGIGKAVRRKKSTRGR